MHVLPTRYYVQSDKITILTIETLVVNSLVSMTTSHYGMVTCFLPAPEGAFEWCAPELWQKGPVCVYVCGWGGGRVTQRPLVSSIKP